MSKNLTNNKTSVRCCEDCYEKIFKIECNKCNYAFCIHCTEDWHDRKPCKMHPQ